MNKILSLVRKLNEHDKTNYSDFSTMGTHGRVKLRNVINALQQSGVILNNQIRGFDEKLIDKIMTDMEYTDTYIRDKIKQSFDFQ